MLKPTLIFLGAGTGGLLRHWLGAWVHSWSPAFPLGTMLVNISGCLAMGFLAALWSGPGREEYRAAILIGLLGGYTTFSSFGRESLALAHDAQWLRAGLYILGTVVLSLAGTWLGWAIARGLVPPTQPVPPA